MPPCRDESESSATGFAAEPPFAVVPKAERFSHEDANAISRWVLRRETARTVVIDLSHATDATTAAFATLVLLRRDLLRDGRDLRLSGLRERAQWVYRIARLDEVLPSASYQVGRDAERSA